MKGLAAGAALAVAAVVLAPGGAGAQSESAGPVFADVPVDAYYHQPVQSLAAMGVFEGTECEEGFCPGRPLLRREMAVWLIRALEGSDGATDHDSRFADVEDDDWQTPYMERMADLEITVGCRSDPPRFCPDSPVSRGQMASFLTRALDLPPALPAGFADVDPEGNVHGDNISRLYAAKITVGCRSEPLRFCPSQSVSRAQMATFIYRALQWRADKERPRIVEDENPGVFLTEENDLSRFIKYEIVDKYADEYPWLMEVWNYTNHPDFAYWMAKDAGASVGYEFTSVVDGGPLRPIRATDLLSEPGVIEDHQIGFIVFIHEMAHVYTQATDGVSEHPGPIAIAHLYFAQLDASCPLPFGPELFAETAGVLYERRDKDPSRHLGFAYWPSCPPFSGPPHEAEEVVASAFEGEMPQWLYDTFQLPDGSLDYKAIWSAVKAELDHTRVRLVYQLKDEFGGYCSDWAAEQSAFGNSSLRQPWRDGGCP